MTTNMITGCVILALALAGCSGPKGDKGDKGDAGQNGLRSVTATLGPDIAPEDVSDKSPMLPVFSE